MFEMIHYHQAMGNFQDGLACCQSLSTSENKKLSSLEKDVVLPRCIIQSYLELDQPQLAFILAQNYAQSNDKREALGTTRVRFCLRVVQP